MNYGWKFGVAVLGLVLSSCVQQDVLDLSEKSFEARVVKNPAARLILRNSKSEYFSLNSASVQVKIHFEKFPDSPTLIIQDKSNTATFLIPQAKFWVWGQAEFTLPSRVLGQSVDMRVKETQTIIRQWDICTLPDSVLEIYGEIFLPHGRSLCRTYGLVNTNVEIQLFEQGAEENRYPPRALLATIFVQLGKKEKVLNSFEINLD